MASVDFPSNSSNDAHPSVPGKYRWTTSDQPVEPVTQSSTARKGSAKPEARKRGSVLLNLPSPPSFSPAKAGEHWMKDHESKTCLVCQTTFTLSRRRHHCRKCGRLVCAECSKTRMTVSGSDAVGGTEHDVLEISVATGNPDVGASGGGGGFAKGSEKAAEKAAKTERWCDGETE